MRAKNRYGGYRGRRTGRDMLKYLIIALAVLAAVLAGILFAGRDRLAKPEQSSDPGQEQSQLPAQPQPESRPEQEPAPEAEPEPVPEEPEFMAAVGIEAAQVLDGSWRSHMQAMGGNAVVVNVKPDGEALGWASEHPDALRVGASSQQSGINERLRAMNEAEDVYTVARMSCFRDELLANTYDYCIHSNSGYRWKDFGGVHWVSPAHEGVQDYLVALAVELAQLGFDEILLDNCGYPQDGSGEMGWIKRGDVYDLQNLDKVISAFLNKVRTAVEPYGTVVSVCTNAVVIQAEDTARTGLSGAVLESCADRIWISEIDTAAPLAEMLSDVGVSNVGHRLVTQSSAIFPGQSWDRAVLLF